LLIVREKTHLHWSKKVTMHLRQQQFCEAVRNKYPGLFYKKKVLDCGSCDVNGNNRYLFLKSDYIGIDIVAGMNVDIVTSVADYKPSCLFDVVISTEMLEHDSTWKKSVTRMWELLEPGGILIITCASGKRKKHATTLEGEGYYKNVGVEEFCEVIRELSFSRHVIKIGRKGVDLYFWGMKREEIVEDEA